MATCSGLHEIHALLGRLAVVVGHGVKLRMWKCYRDG